MRRVLWLFLAVVPAVGCGAQAAPEPIKVNRSFLDKGDGPGGHAPAKPAGKAPVKAPRK